MDNKMLKNNLYLMKALESKGLSLEECVQMNEKEIQNLPISTKLKEFIFDTQEIPTELKTELEIKQEVKELQKTVDISGDVESVVKDYEFIPDDIKEEVRQEEEKAKLELSEDLELVEKVIANPEVVKMINEALLSKETKSVPTYAKIIKTQIPEELLKEVDSTVVSSMINTRISEIKEAENKNK